MNEPPRDGNTRDALDHRVAVLLRDARAERITADVVATIGVGSIVCADLGALGAAVTEGVGAILLMEEALLDREALALRAILERQPPWSDVPVLVVSPSGGDSPVAHWAERGLRNVTLLERPIRIRVLVSALRSALSARRRQYELRDQVEALRASNAMLERRTEGLRLLAEAAALVLAENDPDAMVNALFPRIARHAGIDVYAAFSADSAGHRLRLSAARGLTEPERERLAATDLPTAPDEVIGALERTGVRACVAYRLTAEGRVLGTLAFGSRTRPRLAAEEQELLGTLARYVTLAKERARLVDALRESDRRKDEFLATLAHELRNPLAPIRNALEIIRQAGDASPEAEYARRVAARQLMQLVRMVDDLLDVSRITAGKLGLHREPVEVAAVIAMAVDTARPAIDAGRHALAVDLAAAPLWVHADPVRLAQVFTNLLNNAAKYTEQGGRIGVGVRAAGEAAEITVADDGLGIEADALARIFEPFAQVDHSLERSRGGLGLGLTLAKRVVELHGGEIEASSAGRGHGSQFIVRIPLAASVEAPAAPRAATAERAQAPLRILVADDNRDAAQTLGLMLRRLGHDVRVVHDGAAAVREAAAFQPALAILDIGMPEMNGYDAATRIRAQAAAGDIVLAALTGWGQDEDRRRAREAGFDHHFTKPLDVAALERLLGGIAPRPAARAMPEAP